MAFQTDAVGPFPNNMLWKVSVGTSTDTEVLDPFLISTGNNIDRKGTVVLMDNFGQLKDEGSYTPHDQEQVRVKVEFQDQGANVIDTGLFVVPWSPTQGLGQQQVRQLQQGSGGLTASQALQLTQTQQSTWPAHLIDQLLTPLIGHGTSSTPITANLSSPLFGVIVRITSIPEGMAPITPDFDYWLPTLAVVRVFRANDLWVRAPIHTSSKIVNLWGEGLLLGLVDAVSAAGWLLNLFVEVTFLPGVEGDVFLMRVP